MSRFIPPYKNLSKHIPRLISVQGKCFKGSFLGFRVVLSCHRYAATAM